MSIIRVLVLNYTVVAYSILQSVHPVLVTNIILQYTDNNKIITSEIIHEMFGLPHGWTPMQYYNMSASLIFITIMMVTRYSAIAI